MTNPYPITPRQLDLDKLSGSSLKKTGSYPNIQLDVNFSGSPIAISGSTTNQQGTSIYPTPMDHTHSVESSSDPGSSSFITKTNSEGGLTLNKIRVGSTGSPTYNFESDTDLTFVGAQSITTTSDALTLSPASDLDLTPGGTARVRATNGVRLQSDDYASQTTGWGIGYSGDGDFRYVYADELHAKAFIADLEQALAGGQIISKSVAPLYVDFEVPDYSTSASLIIESFKGFDTFKVFEDADIVRIRNFNRSSGSLSISDCWGEVFWISTDTTEKTQTYEFTRSLAALGGTAGSGVIISKGVLVLDYGSSGNGIIESNAIDGLMGENSPYTQITNWTSHPADRSAELSIGSMEIGSSFVIGGSSIGTFVRTRTGNLKGIFNVSDEFGFYAGDGFRDQNSFLRISSCTVEAHNLPINLYDENSKTISLDPNSPSFAMGSTLPSSYSVGDGLWMGRDTDNLYKFRVGDPQYNMLDWNGSDLFIRSNTTDYMKASGTGLAFYLNDVERLSMYSGGDFSINDVSGCAVITLDSSGGADIVGSLYAGNRNILLNSSGISMEPSSSEYGTSETSLKINNVGTIYGATFSNTDKIGINVSGSGLYSGHIGISCFSGSSKSSLVTIISQRVPEGASPPIMPTFVNVYDSETESSVLIRSDELNISGNANIIGNLNHDGTRVGFYGITPGLRPTITGSRGGNAALSSLITNLAGLGLVIDNTT